MKGFKRKRVKRKLRKLKNAILKTITTVAVMLIFMMSAATPESVDNVAAYIAIFATAVTWVILFAWANGLAELPPY